MMIIIMQLSRTDESKNDPNPVDVMMLCCAGDSVVLDDNFSDHPSNDNIGVLVI